MKGRSVVRNRIKGMVARIAFALPLMEQFYELIHRSSVFPSFSMFRERTAPSKGQFGGAVESRIRVFVRGIPAYSAQEIANDRKFPNQKSRFSSHLSSSRRFSE